MKQGNSFSRTRRYEQGASLVIVVLLAMIVLAGLVVMSSNLALSARRTTTEQKSIIPAQFAAESGVAYAKAQLSAAGQILTHGDTNGLDGANTDVLPGYNIDTFNTLLGQLCPTPVTLPAAYTAPTAPQEVYGTNSKVKVLGNEICKVTSFGDNQAAVLAALYNGGSSSGAYYTNQGISTDANRKRFFKNLFSYNQPVTFGDTTVKTGLQPLSLVQTGDSQYQFFFKIAGLDSTGKVNDSSRNITVDGNSSIHSLGINYRNLITVTKVPVTTSQPVTLPAGTVIKKSFASYGLFVNRAGTDGYYSADNYFSGPVHTNERMTFGYASPYDQQSLVMDSSFTSTGCTSVITDAKTGKDSCSGGPTTTYRTNKIGTSTYRTGYAKNLKGTANSSVHKDPNGNTASYDDYNDGTVTLSVKNGNDAPQFGTDFVEMPKKATNQQSLAKDTGIAMTGDVARVKLTAGTDGYQYIEIAKTTSDYNNPVQFRYKPDNSNPPKMLMEVNVAGKGFVAARKAKDSEQASSYQGWVPTSSGETQGAFGGVIYASGNVNSLTGPPRSDSNSTTAGSPAISQFAGITVAAEKNVTLTGDVTYEKRCNTRSACLKPDGTNKYDNIFGIYSGGGDIRVAWDPNNTSQVTATASGYAPLNAPKNIEIDGFLMASKDAGDTKGSTSGRIVPWNTRSGGVLDDSSSAGGYRGNFSVHGGTIKDSDAVFGNGSTKGWSENYMYDERGKNYAPPGFPTADTVVTQGKPIVVMQDVTTYIDKETPTNKIKTMTTSVYQYDDQGNATNETTTNFSMNNEIRQGTLNTSSN